MVDLRQQLIDKGWKQGVILDSGCIDTPPDHCIGCLVLTQTCDCINPCFEKEPHLELLPLIEVIGKADKNFTNGKNPRKIQFTIHDGTTDLWVTAKIHDIRQIDRSTHEDLEFSANLSIGSSLDSIIVWRVARYARTAFPDHFVNAFKRISDKFGKRIKYEKRDQLIHSLLLSLQPFHDLEDEEEYEIQILLMIEPSVLGNINDVKDLQTLSEELTKILQSIDCFDSPVCKILSLDQMNMMERENYHEFTHYDYLSFGEI